jgi:hypothetical protein
MEEFETELNSRPKKKDQVSDGFHKVSVRKSHREQSRSFVTPDYSNKATWFYNSIRVIDELAINMGVGIIYTFADINKTIINLTKITDREDCLDLEVIVKKNDVIISSGFTVSYTNKQIVFISANSPTDEIKVSYSYENGSLYELLAIPGKKILLDYVETQFSAGMIFNDILVFEVVLNNSLTGNEDVVLGKMEYHNAADFLNKGNHGSLLEAFGELTKNVNIFPWNYLTGYTIKPVGDSTADPNCNEFNKIRIYLKNNIPYTACEIATGTFYCLIEDL